MDFFFLDFIHRTAEGPADPKPNDFSVATAEVETMRKRMRAKGLTVLLACACVCPREAAIDPASAGDGANGARELILRASRHGDQGEYAEAFRLFEAACGAVRASRGSQGASWPPASLDPAMVARHGIAAFKAGHTEQALLHLKTACEVLYVCTWFVCMCVSMCVCEGMTVFIDIPT
jgi:hypothetical protein